MPQASSKFSSCFSGNVWDLNSKFIHSSSININLWTISRRLFLCLSLHAVARNEAFL
jgi:hypothetical protein